MFQDSILEVALALAFLFALLSLVVTSVTEGFANLLSARSRALGSWLESMLEQGKRRLVKKGETITESTITKQVLEHPLVRSLCPPGRALPDYIPPDVFATVMIEILVQSRGSTSTRPKTTAELLALVETLPQTEPLRQALVNLVHRAEGDLRRVEHSLATWFDDSMERLSGWYARQAQLAAFAFATLVTLLLNVDSVMIANKLWESDELRNKIVEQAISEQRVQAQADASGEPSTPSGELTPAAGEVDIEAQLADSLALMERIDAFPLGWSLDPLDRRSPPRSVLGWLSKLLGFAITVLAITLGAPFWFDLLSRFVGLSSAGRAPKVKVAAAAAAAISTSSGRVRTSQSSADTEESP